jgi:MYXO-CTERM domain-containing protein
VRLTISAAVLGLTALPASADPADTAPPECGLEDPALAAAAPPVPRKASERLGLGSAGRMPVVRRISGAGRVQSGALSGVTVYLSPGHGFTYLPDLGAWRTQRGNTHDLVEDLISVETARYFLAEHLRNMGARVVPVRELDTNRERLIVDDADPAVSLEGITGADGFGYGHLPEPLGGADNPMTAGGAQILDASGGGRVRWPVSVAAPGDYNVYVTYVADPSRAADAHYAVSHRGGVTDFLVDQRRHGGTWVYLGRFWIELGDDAAVELIGDGDETGATLSADAIRVGGGMSPFDRGGGVSGRPMFEHAARYYTQWAGAPPEVYDYADSDRSSDVGCRPRFAAWDHEEGEDAVYVAWHTNAPSPARGTVSFAYGPSASGPIDEFSGVPGSLELMAAIHDQLVGDIRAGWDADWQDRGLRTAFFGEVNPAHNPEMPATLIEVAFHDTAEDAEALRDPRFRDIAARAFARGVARYIAERDGAALVLPPDPPVELTARNVAGDLRLSWQPAAAGATSGDPPDGYRVYLSRDGRSFDSGTEVDGLSLDARAVPGLDDAPVIYARVAAVNGGGESMPTEVVGARRAADGAAPVLVVGGFERLDGSLLGAEELDGFALGAIDRGLIDRINDGSYASRHGQAIAEYGASFDGATGAAVSRGEVRLLDYQAVIWFVGEESEADDPLDAGERIALAEYLDAGGYLMISGAELAWALDNVAGGELSEFYRAMSGAGYAADSAGTYELVDPRGPLAGLARMDTELRFDDFGPGSYNADFADVLEPLAAEAVLSYAGVDAGVAAVFDGQVMTLGFPFETVAGAGARAELMARVLEAFAVDPEPAFDEAGGCGCRSSGSPGDLAGLALLALVLASSRTPWRKRRPATSR